MSNLEDFDLLAGHDFGNTQQINTVKEDEGIPKVLIWQKLETPGYQPAAREGHSSITNGLSVLIFGGFEAGRRVNNTVTLDVMKSVWTIIPCIGQIPPARSFHAACSIENLMIIHGGEGVSEPTNRSATAPPVINLSAHQKSEKSLDSFSADRSVVDRNSGTMKGVCPLDSIQDVFTLNGNNKRVGNVESARDGPITDITSNLPRVSCFDDFYVLDTLSYTWYEINCSLAPLPRKGHTLNTFSLDNQPHVVVFGGYSIENATLSNSLLVCDTKQILAHYETKRKLLQLQQAEVIDYQNIVQQKKLQTEIQIVVWRTLQARSGSAPPARYRHSSSVIQGKCGETLLVIVGGIGRDHNAALADVYILNVDTLTWVNINNGSDSLARGIAGDGPAGGIFGHVSFPIRKMSHEETTNGTKRIANGGKHHADDEEKGDTTHNHDTNIEYELLIFGGSSRPNATKVHCYSSLFALDITEHTWRKVITGHSFPPSRSSHSVTMIQGWSPMHEIPFDNIVSTNPHATPLMGGPSTMGNIRPATLHKIPSKANNMSMSLNHGFNSIASFGAGMGGTTAVGGESSNNTNLRTCAVVFGGVGAIMCAADAWALDLSWRSGGMEQYDGNTNQIVEDVMHYHNQQDLFGGGGVAGTTVFPYDETQDPFLGTVTKVEEAAQLTTSTGGGGGTRMIHTSSTQKLQAHYNQKYLKPSQSNLSLMTNTHKTTNEGIASLEALTRPEEPDSHSASPQSPKSPINITVNGNNTGKFFRNQSFSSSLLMKYENYTNPNNHTTNVNPNINPMFADDVDANNEEFLLGEAIHRLKKERALSDIQLQHEREYNVQLEKKLSDTQKELQEAKEGTQSIEAKYQEEIQQLKELLSQALGRERKLQDLNEEAYTLLTLYGMQQVTTAQPYNLQKSKKDSESYAAAVAAVATLSDPNSVTAAVATASTGKTQGMASTATSNTVGNAKGNAILPTKSSSGSILPNANGTANSHNTTSKRPISAIPTANVSSNSLHSVATLRPTTAAIPSTVIGGKK